MRRFSEEESSQNALERGHQRIRRVGAPNWRTSYRREESETLQLWDFCRRKQLKVAYSNIKETARIKTLAPFRLNIQSEFERMLIKVVARVQRRFRLS